MARMVPLLEWPKSWRTDAVAVGDHDAATRLAGLATTTSDAADAVVTRSAATASSASTASAAGLTCLVCDVASFANVDSQRAHFRLDWHRFNVKRALRGSPPVSEEQFDDLDDGAGSNLVLFAACRPLWQSLFERTPCMHHC